MQTVKRRWLACLLCLLIAPVGLMAQVVTEPPAGGSTPAVGSTQALLNVIPADATAFLAIRNLKELDNDVVAVSTQLGFPLGPEGMFPAPLEWLKTSLGLTEGLNERGGAALVVLNAGKAKSFEELPGLVVLFVPATDPKALLTALGGEEATDGVYRVTISGAPSVAAIKEKYVLLAMAPADGKAPEGLLAAARAKGDGVNKTMSPDRVKAYARQDLCLWFNLRNVSEDLRKEVTTNLDQLFSGMTGGAPDSKPADDSAFGVGAQLNKFFNDGEEINVGLALDAKVGLTISCYSRVKAGSERAKMVEAQQPPKGSLLAGLPDEAFIFSAGMVVGMTPEMLAEARKMAEQVIKQIASMDKDPGTPLTPERLKPLVDEYLDLVKDTQRVALSVSNLAGPAGDAEAKPAEGAAASTTPATGGVLGLAVVIETKSAKSWRDRLHKMFDQIKELGAGVAKADGVAQEKIDQGLAAFVWKANAGEVAGASVDHFFVDLAKMPDAEVTPEQLAKVKAVVGEDGILFRVATLGDEFVIITMGGGDKRLEQVITLAKAGQAPIDKNKSLTKIAGRLPKGERVGEVFLAFDNLLSAVDTIAMRVDSPLPVKLTLKNAAPLAMVRHNVDKSAQEINVLLPMELISSMADMVRTQLLPMFMMGGMGGGGQPEGLGEPGGNPDANPDGNSSDEQPRPRPRKPRPQPAE